MRTPSKLITKPYIAKFPLEPNSITLQNMVILYIQNVARVHLSNGNIIRRGDTVCKTLNYVIVL